MENIRYIWGDIIADVFVPWGMGKTLPEAESAERFPQQAACRLFPWKRGTDWRIAQPQTEARGVLGRSWHSYNERLLALHNIGNICAYALRPFHYFHRLDTAFLHFQSGFQAFSFDIKYFPQNNALNFAIFKTFITLVVLDLEQLSHYICLPKQSIYSTMLIYDSYVIYISVAPTAFNNGI